MDPGLTEVGVRQAALVAERLGTRGAGEIVTSPAKRARETAAPFASRLGVEPAVVDDLLELRLPDWTNLSLMEVASKFREARAREPHAWWDGMPGGESFRAFAQRVRAGMLQMLAARGIRLVDEEHAPIFSVEKDLGRVVVFGHGGTNTVAMTVLLGMPCVPWEWERCALGHAGFLRLKAVPLGKGHIFSLRSFNDLEHLPRDLRTI